MSLALSLPPLPLLWRRCSVRLAATLHQSFLESATKPAVSNISRLLQPFASNPTKLWTAADVSRCADNLQHPNYLSLFYRPTTTTTPQCSEALTANATAILSKPWNISSVWQDLLSNIWFIKRTFQPSIVRKKRKHGYLARKQTPGGRRVLKRRRLKGRKRIAMY